MRKDDIVQEIISGGFKYARIMSERVSAEEAKELRKRFNYVQIYAYGDLELPDFETRTQHTALIDLGPDEGAIFSRFNATCKKHIRRAERNPDLKIVPEDEDFSASYALYNKIKKEDGALPDIEEEFQECIFFNAYLGGEVTVTASFYDNGKYIRAKHLASLRKAGAEYAKTAAHATRLINWRVCLWGREKGRKHFDLAGLNLEDPAKKGIVDFKRSFGGEEKDIKILRWMTPEFAEFKKSLNTKGRNIN